MPRRLLCAGLLFFAAGLAHGDALEVSDIRGARVALDAPAARIISLAPHITELLFAVGAGDRIVATVEYSDYPPAAAALPRIGDAFRVDREALVLLDPDLVVAWESGNPAAVVSWLEGRQVPLYVTDARSFADIPRSLRDLGALTGMSERSEELATELERQHAELAERYGEREPVRVFYQISPQPLYTIGGAHILSELLMLCGGYNVFQALDELAPTVSPEAVIQEDPQLIVAGSWPSSESPLASWLKLDMLHAVRDGHLYTVDADLLHRATPRILEGVTELCGVVDRARQP